MTLNNDKIKHKFLYFNLEKLVNKYKFYNFRLLFRFRKSKL